MQNQPVSELRPTDRAIVDQEHLRILSIVHYVLGGLHVALSCVLIFHFVLGLVMALAPHAFGHGPGQAPPTYIGLLMSAFAGCFMLLGWLFGGLTIYSGVCIHKRKHRTFSLVMAGINCLSVPFGTALGVFTIIVLTRESVRSQYAQAAC
jgi:hypothetical protein